ncbi:methionine aminopeptidase 1D, mitochondrial [Patella vulgata]|uniref:methionine aminopeptidase 1D, mitochondrial n=1 Tax=Patella vulgata TaxID=6465 RepID=UPI0024A99474|nr:methionine aminopeptidase 1D, mitochondrial [Patella vulgata]
MLKRPSYSVLRNVWKLNKTRFIRSWLKKSSYHSPALVMPHTVSPVRPFPDHIPKPPYITDPSCIVKAKSGDIEIKTASQINGMRAVCKLARNILNYTKTKLEIGMTTEDIDMIIYNKCIETQCYPSPLLYRGFPKCVCTSVNNVACHGIPDDRKLVNGDIINIDITVYFNGYHGDLSETYLIGQVDEEGQNLVSAAKKCRDAGIAVCKPGVKFSQIGKHISEEAERQTVSVMPMFCGHGIGEYFHGPPDVIHFDSSYKDDTVMKEGMTFTIEPVITEGSDEIEILDDGWTAVSADGSRSAQFEHTVLITSDGVEILTQE